MEAEPSTTTTTRITDLNEDSLAHCATYLSLQDLSNLATTCKSLKRVAYSDSIWQHYFREHWPHELLQTSGLREAYLKRRVAVQQFKFVDPLVAALYVTNAKPFDHIILDKNDFIFSQGSFIQMTNIDSFLNGRDGLTVLSDHNARITCMRLFPFSETSLFRRDTQRKENVLVTSSCDHSIRLWWKGSCQRCFRGHNGPVLTLSDKLLGDGSAKVLASGGEDGTVRLWSLSSSGKRGQHALKATLYGHEKPIKLMSVAGHRTSLLATISKDSKAEKANPCPSALTRYGHMIDNVVLIVTGTLHERDVQELLEKCHPLGMFDSIATLAVAQNMRELYRLVLVDTPLAPYFSECITSDDLDDMNIEIMRNTLYKAYLEDFYRFCQKLGGATSEIMSDLLSFEADRRAVNISINSIGTELTREDRRKLYSNFGLLYPYGHEELAVCEDLDQVRGVMEKYPPYQSIFAKLSYGESQLLDKAFYEEEVKRLCLAFEQQFHYAVFFAYIRLREQEIRNLMWISECVAQNQKSRVHDSVVFIF